MSRINRFVIDTNTLISAFLLSSSSVAAQAYYKIKGQGDIVISEAVFDEFSDVFVRPKFDKYLSLANRLAVIQDFKDIMHLIPVTVSIDACRDPKDNKFLELAIEADAVCIITGDKDLLVLNPFRNIAILTPAEFLVSF